ncbi:MAG: hypothetical protein M2R46_04366 [Verrucomicrobia subdivision 3 bacterium]|nr:hypothetical protein [Limisphaerales bacterium]
MNPAEYSAKFKTGESPPRDEVGARAILSTLREWVEKLPLLRWVAASLCRLQACVSSHHGHYVREQSLPQRFLATYLKTVTAKRELLYAIGPTHPGHATDRLVHALSDSQCHERMLPCWAGRLRLIETYIGGRGRNKHGNKRTRHKSRSQHQDQDSRLWHRRARW